MNIQSHIVDSVYIFFLSFGIILTTRVVSYLNFDSAILHYLVLVLNISSVMDYINELYIYGLWWG